MEDEKELIKRFILRKLLRKRMWMHKYTSIHNLSKGLPESFRGGKDSKKAIEELLKSGLLISKPTNYGLEVFLNIKKKVLIEGIVFCG
ncbi:MAG: hypothetical protein ABIF88_02720 [archaeon]